MLNNNSTLIEKLINSLKFLGHPIYASRNLDGKKIPPRGKCMLLFLINVSVLGIVNMFRYWGTNKKFLMLQDIAMSLMGTLFLIDFLFSPENYKKIVELMSCSVFKNSAYVSEEDISQMVMKQNNTSWILVRLLNMGFTIFWSAICGIPLYEITTDILNGIDIDYETAPTPFPIFVIINFNENVSLFIITYILQAIVSAGVLFVIYLYIIIQSCALVYVTCEVEVLCTTIKNMDTILHYESVTEHDENNNSRKVANYFQEDHLKDFLIKIYIYHLGLIKKTKDVNEMLYVSSFIFNQLMILLFSMEIYCIFMDNVSGKTQYLLSFVTTFVDYGIFCFMGQSLINVSDRLWGTILACSWQTKPSWFKHSVRLLLLGSSKPLQLKPAGLYVLDLNFLLKMMQASYSYCNLVVQVNS